MIVHRSKRVIRRVAMEGQDGRFDEGVVTSTVSGRDKEVVLCLPSSWVAKNFPAGFTPSNWGSPFPDKADFVWVEREVAEQTEELKQLVVYAVLGHDGKVMAYARGKEGGEPDLHAQLSIGLGGHVNYGDYRGVDPWMPCGQRTHLYRACRREVAEEIGWTLSPVSLKLLGFINEDETPVGRKHLGVLFYVDFPAPRVTPVDPAILTPSFLSPQELWKNYYGRMERWSQIVMNAFYSVTREEGAADGVEV